MPKEIDRNQVRKLLEAGAQVVEVLPRSDYDEEHLPGALSIPLSKIDAGVRGRLDPNRPVVVYCWDSA